jgi:Trypsin-like peptidase domain
MGNSSQSLTRAVVKVGDGRGFIIGHGIGLLVVTAAHCLPKIPPAHPARYLVEHTYGNLLGELDGDPKVCAECRFCDVMSDLAILGEPDGQELCDEYDAWLEFIENRPAFTVGDIAQSSGVEFVEGKPVRSAIIETPVWVLQLDGRWTRGRASHWGGPLILSDDTRISSGMSGSPIVTEDGKAVGVVSTGSMNPRLLGDLPMWLCDAGA